MITWYQKAYSCFGMWTWSLFVAQMCARIEELVTDNRERRVCWRRRSHSRADIFDSFTLSWVSTIKWILFDYRVIWLNWLGENRRMSTRTLNVKRDRRRTDCHEREKQGFESPWSSVKIRIRWVVVVNKNENGFDICVCWSSGKR